MFASSGVRPPFRRLQATHEQTKAANGWLLGLERSMLAEEGIPGRPWFRHLVYAPLPSYAAETLPGIREAVVAGDLPRAKAQAAAT